MTTRLVHYTKELEPGCFCWIVPYDGICDNCGSELFFDNLLVEFVGEYVDFRGVKVFRFDDYLYTRCPYCGHFLASYNLYQGIPADSISLFAKVEP